MSHRPSVIVFVTQYMPTGGIESHLREFCYRMAEAGVTLDIIVLNSSMLPETEAFFKTYCRKVYLYKGRKPLGRILWLLKTCLLISTNRYTAVYTNGQGESIFPFSRFINYRKWIHHHYSAFNENDPKTWGRNYKKVIERANTVITCSTGDAHAMELTLNRSVDNIPCFSADVSGGTRSEAKSLRFGYYGKLLPEKGIDLLCSLSNDEDLKAIEIHIWGEGEAYPATFFKAYPNIHYHGTFSGNKQLINIVSELDAYLLISSQAEGLPISLLEIMSAGLPWLATNRGGIPDIACDPLSTRVISPYSSYDEIKGAVLTLARDIKSGIISKNLQKEFYIKKFSYWVLANRWMEVMGLNI